MNNTPASEQIAVTNHARAAFYDVGRVGLASSWLVEASWFVEASLLSSTSVTSVSTAGDWNAVDASHATPIHGISSPADSDVDLNLDGVVCPILSRRHSLHFWQYNISIHPLIELLLIIRNRCK